MSKKIISITSITNKSICVLRSDEDYERWFQEEYNFSMFSENEVKNVMEDDKPESYPCIPLIQKDNPDVIYVGNEIITYLFNKFKHR